jgi:hypothetical protein
MSVPRRLISFKYKSTTSVSEAGRLTSSHHHHQPSLDRDLDIIIIMHLLAALALLTASGATAMPTTGSPDVTVYDPRAVPGDGTSAATQLSKRSSIMTIKFHTSDDCVGSLGTYEVPDVRLSGCLPISISRPGRSVWYTIDNGY